MFHGTLSIQYMYSYRQPGSLWLHDMVSMSVVARIPTITSSRWQDHRQPFTWRRQERPANSQPWYQASPVPIVTMYWSCHRMHRGLHVLRVTAMLISTGRSSGSDEYVVRIDVITRAIPLSCWAWLVLVSSGAVDYSRASNPKKLIWLVIDRRMPLV